MARHYDDWVEGFSKYTEKYPSPVPFRKWAAISAVAGALERKVFLRTGQGPVYPNLYVLLCGPPGVGKSEVTGRTQELWLSLEKHHVAASSLTRASLADQLDESERTVSIVNQPALTFNSLLVCANELGVFIPSYENDFMNTLTDLYDCRIYSEHRRGNKLKIEIPKPQLNILAGTTPSYLNNVLPAGAWDQGFLSRTIVVYSGETFINPLFDNIMGADDEMEKLQEDLAEIGNLIGEFRIDEEAKKAIDAWHMNRPKHEPSHPKLVNYNTRRTLHMLKLCMVACTAKTDDLTITLDHFQTATDWLVEAEKYMPDVFKSMNMGGDANAIQETWYYLYQLYVKENAPISEARVYTFLQERVPAHSVERIVEVMVKAGILEATHIPKIGPGYKPKAMKR